MPQFTTELAMKPLPLMVSVPPADATATLAGEREEMDGAGFETTGV